MKNRIIKSKCLHIIIMIIFGCYHTMAGEGAAAVDIKESIKFTYYQLVNNMIEDAKSQSKEADLKELFKSGSTSWSGECYKFTEESQTMSGEFQPSETTSFELLVRIERGNFEVSFGIPPVLPRVEIKSDGTFFLGIYHYNGDPRDTDAFKSNLLCENPYLIQKEGRDVLLCSAVETGIRFRTSTHACYFMKNE